MKLIFRIFVALIGFSSFRSAWQHWFDMQSLPAGRGLKALGDIGQANIRADVGGLFLVISIFTLLAAWQQNRQWVLAALLAVGAAIMGRFISLAVDGVSERVLSPITIEAIVIAILLGAWWVWREKPEGL